MGKSPSSPNRLLSSLCPAEVPPVGCGAASGQSAQPQMQPRRSGFKHSSQPRALGVTSRIVFSWLHSWDMRFPLTSSSGSIGSTAKARLRFNRLHGGWIQTGTMCVARPRRSRSPEGLRWPHRHVRRTGYVFRADWQPTACCRHGAQRACPME